MTDVPDEPVAEHGDDAPARDPARDAANGSAAGDRSGERPADRDGKPAGGDESGGGAAPGAGAVPTDGDDGPDIEALRAEVEEKYDFENFGPADMAEMTAAEWEAVFDPDSWITGDELLDRVEKDLSNRIASREVFAVLDRRDDPPSVVAYSDEGWAVVYGDGSVEGEGTVLRDVKPTVALCSMDSYEVREPPERYELPTPEEVEEGTGEFGNLMIQAVAGMQILGGVGLVVAYLFLGVETIVAPVAGGFFLLIGVFLLAVVANARLSDRFRAEEYRDRLRAAGITDGDGDGAGIGSGGGDGDPEFVPFEQVAEEALADARGGGGPGIDPSADAAPTRSEGHDGPPEGTDDRDGVRAGDRTDRVAESGDETDG